MRIFDYESLAAQWLRRVRGKRSQVGFSRRLKYGSNVVYLWESGRNWPTADKALWAVGRTGVDVQERVGGFFREPPAWLRRYDVTDPEGVRELLGELKGTTSILELASRIGVSRFAVSRWLKGEARPRLPDFFRFVEAASLRLLEFLALFVDPATIPAAAKAWAQLEAARRLGYDQPWTQAVFLALQLQDYRRLSTHRPGWIAERLGIILEIEQQCLELLEHAGYLRRLDHGKLEAVPVETVDTRRDPVAAQRLRQWWATAALERMREAPDEGVFSYNVFTVSEADYERLRQLQRQYFRGLRAIVSASEPAERVVLTQLQIFALDGDR